MKTFLLIVLLNLIVHLGYYVYNGHTLGIGASFLIGIVIGLGLAIFDED